MATCDRVLLNSRFNASVGGGRSPVERTAGIPCPEQFLWEVHSNHILHLLFGLVWGIRLATVFINFLLRSHWDRVKRQRLWEISTQDADCICDSWNNPPTQWVNKSSTNVCERWCYVHLTKLLPFLPLCWHHLDVSLSSSSTSLCFSFLLSNMGISIGLPF